MKRIKVSNNVIRRMPRYLRKLDDLNAAGIERISSGELGRQMGLTPSQIRQDFSCFGEFGQQGYGYNVVALRGEVAKILGMNRNYSAVLVGVGNIGRALVENFCFEQYGFTLKAAFDINPDLIGKEMHGIVVHDFSTLDDILADIQPDVAVLCVPKAMANDVANEICSVGVKAIWNFTNTELQVKDADPIIENIHFSDSLLALGYYIAESQDEAEARAAAEALAAKIKGQTVTAQVKGGASGKLYGKVTGKEVAELLTQLTGTEIDKKKVELPSAIKEFGSYDAAVRLYAGVVAPFKLKVEEL